MPNSSKSSPRSIFSHFKREKHSKNPNEVNLMEQTRPPARGFVSALVAPTADVELTTNIERGRSSSIQLSLSADHSTMRDREATAEISKTVVRTSTEDLVVEEPKLWDLAFARAGFDEHETQILLRPVTENCKTWSAQGFVEEVKKLTGKKYAECEQSKWTSEQDGGDPAIVRQAEKVIVAALELKDLVAAGLKFDVTGYGATAWSFITFGLQVQCCDPTTTI